MAWGPALLTSGTRAESAIARIVWIVSRSTPCASKSDAAEYVYGKTRAEVREGGP